MIDSSSLQAWLERLGRLGEAVHGLPMLDTKNVDADARLHTQPGSTTPFWDQFERTVKI
jgi:hypothetical protein